MRVNVVVVRLMRQTEFMTALGRRPDYCVALGIEGDDGDRVPVSGVPRRAPRGSRPCLLVERMASLQDGAVLTGMPVCRADVADATVAVIVVVPTDERTRPRAGLLEVREALHRELWSVLRRAEHRLDEGVVIADARAGVGGCQTEPVHHGQDRSGLERRAVIPVQLGLVIQRVQVLGEGRVQRPEDPRSRRHPDRRHRWPQGHSGGLGRGISGHDPADLHRAPDP